MPKTLWKSIFDILLHFFAYWLVYLGALNHRLGCFDHPLDCPLDRSLDRPFGGH